MNKSIILFEDGNHLIIKERVGGALTTVMRITYGAVTQAQLAYFRANLKGKIKQEEADLILKYFYGIGID